MILCIFTFLPTRAFIRKKIKLHEMKNEKKTKWFSYTSNTANFEVFLWNISLCADLLFIKSVLTTTPTYLGIVKK